jgi:hypothetical protein
MNPLLYNRPSSPSDWLEWGSIHQGDHFAIAAGIFRSLSVLAPVQPLDPVPLDLAGLTGWARVHQGVHSEQNGLLRISGSDLTGVDFRQPEQLEIWLRLHALEHERASAALAGV